MFFSPQYTNETVPEQQQIREGIMEQRQSGEKNPWKKQKRKEREWAWWESYSSGTGNILVQGCQSNVPPPPQTHTPVLLYPSPDAPGGIQATPKSTESQMYERMCMREKEKERTQMFPCPCLSLPTRLVGCLRAVDVCTLLWLVPDVLHWPKSPRQ